MPLYEYQCASCQRVHEVMQKFSDEPMKTCPDCQGPVTKLMSMSSFALKGSGWYTTDYKRKSSGSSTAGEGGKSEAAGKPEAAAPAKVESSAGSSDSSASKSDSSGSKK